MVCSGLGLELKGFWFKSQLSAKKVHWTFIFKWTRRQFAYVPNAWALDSKRREARDTKKNMQTPHREALGPRNPPALLLLNVT